MVNRSVGIPESLVRLIEKGGRGVATRLRQLALRELEGEGVLSAPPLDDLHYVPLAIDATFEEALDAARSRMPTGTEWSDGQVIAALAIAAAAATETQKAPEAPELCMAVLRAIPGLTPRTEQVSLAKLVDAALQHGRIAMLEAATGSGKGLVIAAAAIAAAERGQKVAIAAPTHQINRATMLHLTKQLGERLVKVGGVATLIGRSGFVSTVSLQQSLEDTVLLDEQTRTDAKAWLHEQRQRYAQGERDGLYQAETLMKRCPLLPREDIRLRAYEQDEAASCYEAQFGKAMKARIVMVSHAMLATLTRKDYIARRRELELDPGEAWRDDNALLADGGDGLMAGINVLLIDEAHVLEQSFAGALSEVVSLRALARKCARLCASVPASGRLADAVDDSVNALGVLNESSVDTERSGVVLSQVMRLHTALSAVLNKAGGKAGKASPARPDLRAVLDELRRQAAALAFGLNSTSGQVIHLRHSPDRRYPQLTIGPRSVRKQLDFLWQRVQSAALFSATLYVQTMSGIPSCAVVSSRLQIDPLRVLSHIPVLPDWLTRPVTLHLPAPSSVTWLPPGQDASEKERKVYFKAVAEAVSRFCEPARGGSLVLCTSHEAVEALAAGWSGEPGRRVRQSRDEPFTITLQRFAALAAEGIRPVWFATGQAWTGLDIYSGLPEGEDFPPADQDLVLTHLVIPRLPFDVQTTSTELARRQYRQDTQWLSVVHECQMMLRQGMGRLVRRQGLTDRHIAVLDPRGVSGAYRGMSSIKSLWSRYPNQQVLNESAVGIVKPTPISKASAVPAARRRTAFD